MPSTDQPTYPAVRFAYAISGTGHPASGHAADLTLGIDSYGFAVALCRRTLSVSVDHDTDQRTGQTVPVAAVVDTPGPFIWQRPTAWVSCLRCAAALEALGNPEDAHTHPAVLLPTEPTDPDPTDQAAAEEGTDQG